MPDSDAGFRIGDADGSSITDEVFGLIDTNRSFGGVGNGVGNRVRLT